MCLFNKIIVFSFKIVYYITNNKIDCGGNYVETS